ncbi:MAG: right-handed parallel beta-helix repeat-containing protein [Fimbriimonadaceae bacterium]|nr:right-handed parallel beta-helix repeat-containing protein [Fimbriimonadaceae bacterium]
MVCRLARLALLSAALTGCTQPGGAAVVPVADAAGLRAALRQAGPGTHLALAPGNYGGGWYLNDLHGNAAAPIVLAAADPARRPVFEGGSEGLHLTDCTHLVLDGLVVRGANGNGLNIDDGGTFDSPTHHLTLRRLLLEEVGPQGNRDGLKLSGLTDFSVEECVFRTWGDGGSGIDMVGCRNGSIRQCSFGPARGDGANAIQAKGGSSAVTIQRCRFINAGGRALNLGGSTGLQFFRPRPAGYEARDLTVEGCFFEGSQAPLAFVGCDGATVRFNTFIQPTKWFARILQETTAPGFVPCRNGIVADNVIVFSAARWAEGGLNIGPQTAPETFRFARNLWYCSDRPDRSRPTLPVAETAGVYGQDPRFRDAAQGDYTPAADGPGHGKGHTALP